MNAEILEQAMALAEHVRHLFVATVNAKGIPHLATAERIVLEGDDLVGVTAWFCPKTAENVDANANISVVIWDSERDVGFQLVGEVTQVRDLAMLNGYMPEETEPIPQIERKLVVKVCHILKFSHAHHSDSELT